MLQEMEIKKALKAHIGGREVLVISTGIKNGGATIVVDSMEDYFAGCRFLVEVPATVNPDFELATGITAREEPTKPMTEKKIDVGKLMALHKAGWENSKIAAEMHISGTSVSYHLKKLKRAEDKANEGI